MDAAWCSTPCPPLPRSSRRSMTSPTHCGCGRRRRTMPTPAQPMPGGHWVVVTLPIAIGIRPQSRRWLVRFVVVIIIVFITRTHPMINERWSATASLLPTAGAIEKNDVVFALHRLALSRSCPGDKTVVRDNIIYSRRLYCERIGGP